MKIDYRYWIAWSAIILTFVAELVILYLMLTGKYASPLCLKGC